VPPKWAAALDEVCGKVAAQVPGFELILDRVICFQNRRRESPVVLSCGQAANPSLRSLHRHLLEELARVGFRVGNRAHLVPHLTLLYDRRGLRETPIEPVTWPVQEVVLVRSEVGATKYVPLGRWPLRG
jgi:2'-5' RNA ligase